MEQSEAVWREALDEAARTQHPQQWIRVEDAERLRMEELEDNLRTYLEGAVQGALGRRCWMTDVEMKEEVERLEPQYGDEPGLFNLLRETILVLTVRVGGPL